MADKKKHDGKGHGKHHDNTHGNEAKDLAAQYGWSSAFLNGHPELKKIFHQAVKNTWSPQRFVAELQDTAWFKHHADTARQAIYLHATDPKTFGQRVDQLRNHIADAAGALGIEVGKKTLDQWAHQALMFGWDESQINNHLAGQVDIMGAHSGVGGSLAATQDRLKAAAFANGVTVSNKTMQNWLQAIVRGNSTFEEYNDYITKMAVAAHPNWSKELNGGMTVADIADPYKQQMAQLLEIDPAQIDMNNSMLKRALSYKDDKTGDYKSMTMSDFGDMVRQDPRWMKTDNAKESFMNTGSNILKMFGLST